MQKILLASNNSGKLREFNNILGKFGFTLVSMADFNLPSPEETGLTFVENSIIKARAAAKIANLPTLADDSGLVVKGLNGAPGIYSARFSGKKDDGANNAFLLEKLKDIQDRQAYFYCTLVLLNHHLDPAPKIANGAWQGKIAESLQGQAGFGYDPIFIPNSYKNSAGETIQNTSKTAAMLTSEEKNSSSHRALAIANLLKQLELDTRIEQ